MRAEPAELRDLAAGDARPATGRMLLDGRFGESPAPAGVAAVMIRSADTMFTAETRHHGLQRRTMDAILCS